MSIIEISYEPKRVIYFKDHYEEKNSTMITKVCKDYKTISKLLLGE